MKALAAALVEAQNEMPAVEADSLNPHFGNKFVSLDHLIAKTKPVLTKHGLAIVQLPDTTPAGAPGLRTVLIHTSGESVESTVPLVLAKQDMQGLGAALTYARRYGWAAALGICDETDDDGNAASAPGTGANTSTAPASARGEASSGTGESGVGGRAAGSSSIPPSSPAASSFEPPVSARSSAASLKWKYGPHAGRTLEETPLDFILQYVDPNRQGFKPGFMVDKCNEFLAAQGHVQGDEHDESEGIPF